jgi:hypothetical protein
LRPCTSGRKPASEGGILIVNLEKAAQIPALAEPWFLTFNAAVEFHPCMTPQDLGAAGLDALGKRYGG